MPQKKRDIKAKVREVLSEPLDERLQGLFPFPHEAGARITRALKKDFGEETAWDIAFHLLDWQEDGAVLLAIALFPEKFTLEEIRSEIGRYIVHAPNHIAAAAKLLEWPIEDTAEGGPLLKD